MKQPRSSSQANTKLAKKPLLPSFRQSKVSNKVQQLAVNNKSQLYFNNKLIPLEILAQRKSGQGQKIIINPADIVIFEGGRITKANITIPSSLDKTIGREWIQVNLGQTFHHIKIKKIGDENAFGPNGQMISWDKPENIDKKLTTIINVKEIMRSQHLKLDNTLQLHQNQGILKQDKSKQMKAFVANIMSKKLGRRSTERSQGQSRFNSRKQSQIIKSKPILGQNQLKGDSGVWNGNPPSTAASILSAVSGPRSFRKDMLKQNLLKDSKFTGKSQKQTSIGQQSVFLNNNKVNQNLIHLSSVQNDDEYAKRKLKFDSQPYFYQNSTITSQFSNKNESMQKFHSVSRQKSSRNQLNNNMLELPQHNTENVQLLLNKSEHESEQQVQEDIKRSELMKSSVVKNQDQQFETIKQKGDAQESSQCFQSKQLQSKAQQSEGTIYQSKYQ